MKKYNTLLFDADDTLLDFKKSEATALEQMMRERGLPFSPQIAELYNKVNRGFWEMYERGEIEKKEILVGRYQKLFELMGVKTDAEAAARTYEGHLCHQYFVIDGAIELLNDLKRDYEIYLVTNGNEHIQKHRLNGSGVNKLVNGVFVSEAVGAPKPEKRYFDYVFSCINETDKSKILIIGDSMSSDILGGINAGIDTCWYNPYLKAAKYTPTYEINSLAEIKKLLEEL